MALQVKDVDDSIPNHLALKNFADTRGVGHCGLSSVLAFNDPL